MRAATLLFGVFVIGFGQSVNAYPPRAAAPTIATTAAQNGAVIVSLATTTAGSTIYYTVDGSIPGASSQIYHAPFLVVSKLTVKAIATADDYVTSTIASRKFAPQIPPGTLVWSDEFTNSTSAIAQPDAKIWTYDIRTNGNKELEKNCAWGANAPPCTTAHPNTYVGTDGYLHIIAEQPSAEVFTAAQLKTQGLFSFQYGRFEARALVPESQGMWPAIWLMGNNIVTDHWPGCGEMDVLERTNAAKSPDWNQGSIHGPGFIGPALGAVYEFPAGQTAAGWHTYGMIWSPNSIAYYVDDPARPYVTYTPESIKGRSGAVWPFDAGQSNFIILNLAIGGDWPGNPDSSTQLPAEMLVDYVRVYTN